METIHQRQCRLLREKLNRLDKRSNEGRYVPNALSVEVELIEGLLSDSEDLARLLKKHPELRREVPYAA